MAQLLIRQLPDEVKEGLRERARANGRSMEAEARAILVDIVFPGDAAVDYEGAPGTEALFARHGVKLLPKNRDGRVVTLEEARALMDELAI